MTILTEKKMKPEPTKQQNATSSSTKTTGRDETLSTYLSGLGSIPLLDKDREQELAASFREAELGCWQIVIEYPPTLKYLSLHPELREMKEQKLLKDLIRSFNRQPSRDGVQKRRSSIREKKIAQLSEVLRGLDEDRKILAEVLAYLDQTEITPKKGESAQERRQRTICLERENRIVLEKLYGQHRRANQLRNRFVRANLRLVVSVARRFHHYRLPLIDLIQEGNIGLIKSVHRFDHRKGFRFSTYAHWWIRQAIERAIMNKGTQIRLPVHIFDARREVAKSFHFLSQKLGRDPTVDELSESIGVSRERVEEIMNAVPREPTSIDERSGDDDDRSLGETIQDESQRQPDESVISVDQAHHLYSVMETLNPMEIDIIQRRFGLIYHGNETLEEIGKSYNLSRERVRQIQVQGLRKMYIQCRQRNIAI